MNEMQSVAGSESGAEQKDHGHGDEHGHDHLVTILVNEQKVVVKGPHLTGHEIKEAAIAAGVAIDLGFQLIEELANDRTRVIGDYDKVEVHEGSRFIAVAPDDNS